SMVVIDSTGTGIGTKIVSVVATDHNGCQATDTVKVVFKNCSGVTEIPGMGVEIFPNPNNGIFTLKLLSPVPTEISITIFSASGAKVYEDKNVPVSGNLSKKIDLSGAARGTYLLEISGEKGKMFRKITINQIK
ncbi:MAG: T9SS type A sorting domain-containing protein, partial [Syntrophothermus sp.]